MTATVTVNSKDNAKTQSVTSGRVATARLAGTPEGQVSTPSSVTTDGCASDDNDPCPICEKALMERARSLECCHTFCRACIMEKCRSSFDRCCPICRVSFGDKPIHLYNRDTLPIAFRPVMATKYAEESRLFPSASRATQALSLSVSAKDILDACDGENMKARLVQGYSWSYPQSITSSAELREVQEAATRGPNGSKVVERLSAKTGKVIASYPSAAEAGRQLGVDRSRIACAARQGNVIINGFFFRYKNHTDFQLQGSAKQLCVHGENQEKEKTSDIFAVRNGLPQPVERLSLKTGKVLSAHTSIADAARKLGIRQDAISRVARGELPSAGGFAFRHARLLQGESTHQIIPSYSNATNNQLPVGNRKECVSMPVEMLCLQSGTVLAKYSSLTEAGRDLRICRKAIARVARGDANSAGGYFFRFQGSDCTPQVMALSVTEYSDLLTPMPNPDDNVLGKSRKRCRRNVLSEAAAESISPLLTAGEAKSDCQREKNASTFDNQCDMPAEGLDESQLLDPPSVPKGSCPIAPGLAPEKTNCHGSVQDESAGACEDVFRSKSTDVLIEPGETVGDNNSMKLEIANSARSAHQTLGKAVEQVCLKSGTVLATYSSIRAAADSVGVSKRSEGGCCRPQDKLKTLAGFGWRFAEPNLLAGPSGLIEGCTTDNNDYPSSIDGMST